MADRTFTLSEAQGMLPVLESLLRKAMDSKKLVDEIEVEFQQIAGRVFVSGGMLLNPIALAARKGEREKALQGLKDAVAEIDAAGVQVKDLDMGLLDFPCMVEDRTILLCWKMGEKAITHWHGTDEGFKGRKPIDEKIAKAKPREKPN